MTKIEITDAMVERACKSADLMWSRDMVRMVLDAALNPPPEPEIEVTKEMQVAGETTWKKHWGAGGNLRQVMIPDIYRAMRALEPKPDVAHDDGTVFTSRGPAHMHRRSDDTSRNTYFHRRAGDPK